jgi:hypothetical protein
MSDLQLDLGLLEQLYVEIQRVLVAFTQAKPASHELTDAVGVYEDSPADGLAHQVERFSTGWDIRRGQIIETMTSVSNAITAIHDTFQELDATLADALTQAA